MSGPDGLRQDLMQDDQLQENLMRENPAGTAALCSSFHPDLEEEWADDEEVSCLNCFFRRWTSRSFDCMAPERGGLQNV
ncbi:hypothetical protein KIH86_12290 [Paenibacillus sp. HN-1]|uniref:hypothetical protein n=1 Tax=Paenibacillus TaxID=44249 RepID=UPI001CA9D423|nr:MULTISPECIES: hypothetical protein [Paenibacillus]MBY9081483.1 hypothetical protein [Paenibacillus sp. CGMCC 1.18879]MBY9085003.1 hypothetical protein [Paenibacillus sinensis]